MKKKYVTPEVNIVAVEAAGMLAVSSIGYSTQEASNDYEALAGERRGAWGDLWK